MAAPKPLFGLLVLLAGVLGCQAGSGPGVDSGPRAQEESGRELYVSLCASCHGTSGIGDGPMAGELRTAPSDLTIIAAKHGGTFPRQEIAEIVDGRRPLRSHGPGSMPVWGRHFERSTSSPDAPSEMIVRGQIGALVDYLESIQRKP